MQKFITLAALALLLPQIDSDLAAPAEPIEKDGRFYAKIALPEGVAPSLIPHVLQNHEYHPYTYPDYFPDAGVSAVFVPVHTGPETFRGFMDEYETHTLRDIARHGANSGFNGLILHDGNLTALRSIL